MDSAAAHVTRTSCPRSAVFLDPRRRDGARVVRRSRRTDRSAPTTISGPPPRAALTRNRDRRFDRQHPISRRGPSTEGSSPAARWTVPSSPRARPRRTPLRLGGAPAADYQRRIIGGYGTRVARSALVKATGGVVCSTRVVLPIAADPTPTRGTAPNLGPSDLGILEDCNGAGNGVIRFQNNGSQAGTLNWMFSEGGTASTVNATGNVLNPFPAEHQLRLRQPLGGAVDLLGRGRRDDGQPPCVQRGLVLRGPGDRGVGADPIAAAGRPRYGSTLGGLVVTCQQAG